MVDLVRIVHEVNCFNGSSFLRLSVILHNERYIPDYDDAFFSSRDSLWSIGYEDGLSQGLLRRYFWRIQLEASFAAFPEPKQDSGLSSGGEFVLVMIELDELLHAVYFFVHFGSDEAGLFFLPFPEADPLFSGSWCLAQGGNHGAVSVNIQSQNALRVRVEDGFAGSAGIDVPNHQH